MMVATESGSLVRFYLSKMSLFERVWHSLLFEFGAIVVSMLVVWVVGTDIHWNLALSVSVAISIMAMLWNFVFNYCFDKVMTVKREHRSMYIRVVHTVLFEFGLLIFTVPFIAYYLDLSFVQALLADIGLTVVVAVYTFIFNWVYDLLRLRWV